MKTLSHLISRRSFIALSATVLAAAAAKAATFPKVQTYRNPGCECCEKWVAAMQAAGFEVAMQDHDDLDGFRAGLGIPAELYGCHTSLIGDHVFEGHVPPEDVISFLSLKPPGRGLAVPGMPMGSPGMETGSPGQAFDTMIFTALGDSKVYARHGG